MERERERGSLPPAPASTASGRSGRVVRDIEVWSASDPVDHITHIRQPLLASASHDSLQGAAHDAAEPGSSVDNNYNNASAGSEAKSVTIAIYLSLGANMALLAAKLAIYVLTLSNAVMASLADSVVDILSQGVLAFAEYHTRHHDPRYPIGKARLETIGVVVSAGIMSVCSIEVIQSSLAVLWRGFVHGEPTYIHLDLVAYCVLGAATAVKAALFLYCAALRRRYNSGAALALAEDHFNDILSNVMALATACVASTFGDHLWWADSAGGALISVYIIMRWYFVAKEHVDMLVGKGAEDSFIERVKEMAQEHHKLLLPDEIRAYFFGQKYFVEIECILPSNMSVQVSHDIGLGLQHKVEALEEVERAFVHIDYQNRETPEHRTERLLEQGAGSRAGSREKEQSPRTQGGPAV